MWETRLSPLSAQPGAGMLLPLKRMAELPNCGFFLLCIFLFRHDKVQHIYVEGPVLALWIPTEY